MPISPLKASLLTLTIWGGLMGLHYSYVTTQYLADPQKGDLYAHSWFFQAITFFIWPFPAWLAGLTLVLCAELVYYNRLEKQHIRES